MRLIIAVIRPEKLQAVQAALNDQDLHLLTVSEVFDCRQTQRTREIYRGREMRRPSTKLRLELAVDDSCIDSAIQAIERAGTCGESCNDEAFVMGLDDHVRMGSWGREPVPLDR